MCVAILHNMVYAVKVVNLLAGWCPGTCYKICFAKQR